MHQHAHMPKDAGGSQTLIHTPAVGLAAHAHEPQSPIYVRDPQRGEQGNYMCTFGWP